MMLTLTEHSHKTDERGGYVEFYILQSGHIDRQTEFLKSLLKIIRSVGYVKMRGKTHAIQFLGSKFVGNYVACEVCDSAFSITVNIDHTR